MRNFGDRIYPENLQSVQSNHLRRYMFATDTCAEKGWHRILDAACGVGYGSAMLHKIGCDVTGIDADEDAIEHAEKHFPGPHFMRMNISGVTQIPRAFDCVVSIETIEHLPEPFETLCEFRMMALNLIVSVPNQLVVPFAPDKFEGHEYPHLKHYTPDALDAILVSSGWKVDSRWSQRSKNEPTIYPNVEGQNLLYVCS